jgi:hypothetical protein
MEDDPQDGRHEIGAAVAFLMVNWLSIVIAAAAAWLFGALYYGALGKLWVEAQGKTMDQFKAEQAAKVGQFSAQLPFVVAFIAAFVMAWTLYGILTHMNLFTLRAGLIAGALIWLGFVLTTMSVNYAFGGRRLTLTLIDAGHWLGVLIIIGAILGWFGR